MFLIIDNTNESKITFYYALNNRFVQKNFELEEGESILLYLAKLFAELKLSLKCLRYLGVVSGQGRFTATRLAVTVANTLAYALRIPVVGLPNDWQPKETMSLAKLTPVGRYAVAKYSGEANIGRHWARSRFN